MKKQVSEGSLHKWFKGSKSKDGKGGWVNVVTGGTCASDEPGEGTPKCVSSSKRASMSKSERLSAARRKKKADPGQQQKSGAAKPTYVSTDKKKKKMKESYTRALTPLSEKAQKCWKGYEKKGTKKMFGKTYNNCVKKEEVEVVNEISSKTLRNYIIQGTKDVAKRASDDESHSGPKYGKKMSRIDGVSKAADKLAKKASRDKRMKEEVEIVDEAKYEKGASDYGKTSIRNKRAFGKGGNAADPKERGGAKMLRHDSHTKRRGVKKNNKYGATNKPPVDGAPSDEFKKDRYASMRTEAKVDMKTPDYKRATVRDKRYGNPHGSHELGGGIRKDRRADHEARRGVKKEEIEMTRKEYNKLHKDFKSDDPKNPRTTRYVKGKGTVSSPVKFVGEEKKEKNCGCGQDPCITYGDHRHKKDKVTEAKVDKGRSDYGKASIRNYRRKGPGHGDPGMFDPSGKRGKTIDLRRKEHEARRGKKGAKVPAYKVEHHQKDKDGNTIPHEDLNELKTSTLLSYTQKATNRLAFDGDGKKKAIKRAKGVKNAAGKLAMRATDPDGSMGFNKNPKNEDTIPSKNFSSFMESAWQRKEGKNKTGGLNEKGRKSYERENPGSDLKAPQPEGGPRKKSFCARMGGVKGPMKKPNGEPTRKALALRKWKC